MSKRDETPRDDIFRMGVPANEFRFEGDTGNTLVGYAATFDSTTRIDSWEGQFDETIQRGAFSKTIDSPSVISRMFWSLP